MREVSQQQPVNLAAKFIKRKRVEGNLPPAPETRTAKKVVPTPKHLEGVKIEFPPPPKAFKPKNKDRKGRKIKWRKQPPVPDGFFYQAVGYIEGVFQPDPEVENGKLGKLISADGVAFPAAMMHPCRRWLNKNSFDPNGKWIVWTIYPRQNLLEDGPKFIVALKGLRVKDPAEAEGNFVIRGFCCHANMEEGKFVLRVWRNPDRIQPGQKVYPVHLVVDGFHQESPEGKYWHVEAVREGDRLVMVDAQVFP